LIFSSGRKKPVICGTSPWLCPSRACENMRQTLPTLGLKLFCSGIPGLILYKLSVPTCAIISRTTQLCKLITTKSRDVALRFGRRAPRSRTTLDRLHKRVDFTRTKRILKEPLSIPTGRKMAEDCTNTI
jgi:hypothetical protein